MIQSIAILTPLYISGFWTLVFLIARPSGNQARYFLGYFMLGVFLIHLGLVFHLRGDYETYALYKPVYNLAIFMVFPMYYFYIRLLTVDIIPKKNYLYHYIPAVVIMIMTLILNIGHPGWMNGYDFPDTSTAGKSLSVIIEEREWGGTIFPVLKRWLIVFQILFYSRASILLFRVHHERILNFYSAESAGKIHWVKISYYTLIFSSLSAAVYAFLGKDLLHVSLVYMLLSSATSSVVEFTIGYLGNRQVQIVKELDSYQTETISDPDNKTAQDDAELKQKIEWVFAEKKLHCNPELSIWDVSGELNTNRTYVSNFINRYFGVNFSRYVNQYRVEEAKKMLQDPESRKFSLETIGERCGFGSLNNFIRVFQSFEGITPGNFRRKMV